MSLYDIYNPYSIQAVTKEYVSIIEASLNNIGLKTRHIDKLTRQNSRSAKGVVVIVAIDAIRAKAAGYKDCILWVQGVGPEESFMRHHSHFRYDVLSRIEKFGIKHSTFVVLVSESMKKHYFEKYFLPLDNCYIMPCFNNEIRESYFFTEKKYEDNLFIYAGSLAPWQCFEQTVALYKQIEDRLESAKLRVLVKEREEASRILEKHGVKRYTINFVPQENIGEEMAKAKFGFCLREDSIVNRVATPTKLSTYIAHGVMPIYSRFLTDFRQQAQSCPFCYCVDNSVEAVDMIVDICNKKINASDVYSAFASIFGNYYSKAYHEKRLTEVLNVRL